MYISVSYIESAEFVDSNESAPQDITALHLICEHLGLWAFSSFTFSKETLLSFATTNTSESDKSNRCVETEINTH